MKNVFSKYSVGDSIPDDGPLDDDRFLKAFWWVRLEVEARVAKWWEPRSFTTMLFAIIEDDAGDAGIVDIVTHNDDAGGTGDAVSSVKPLEDGKEEGVRH